MIRYIIVDDEPLAHQLIEGFCQMVPHLKLEKHCYDALEALEFLQGNSVDLMFLDLNMPKLKGFDFLKTLMSPPKVIVTTAYQEYALEGYELGVVDYLLKPFTFDRFLKAVNKATASPEPRFQATPPKESKGQSFFIKGDKKYHQIEVGDLKWVEAYGNYTKLYTADGMLLCHESLTAMAKRLAKARFMRVHKSYLVSLDKIDTVEGNRIFIDSCEIPIGQTYKSEVNRLLAGE